MKSILAASLLFATTLTAPALAETRIAIDVARDRDACHGMEVVQARFEPGNRLVVTCGTNPAALPAAAGVAAIAPATNVVPLLGGLAPVIGVGVVVAGVAAAAGGSSTSDTQ